MDRHTYRGKRLDTREWVFGAYIEQYHSAKYGQRIDAIFYSDDVKTYRVPVDPATVGQCTGLADKHGKAIFEGDVVRYSSGLHTVHGTIRFGEIPDNRGKFKHIGFYIEWENDGANMWNEWWRQDLLYWLVECKETEITGAIPR